MRVLYLTHVLPYPLDAGPRVRAYYVLRHLVAQGHRITLLTFLRDSDSYSSLLHLQELCDDVVTVPMVRSRGRDIWHLLVSLYRGDSFLVRRDWYQEMVAAVTKTVSKDPPFEVVHTDQLAMAPYGALARRLSSRITTLLDQHNAVYKIPMRLAAQEKSPLKKWLYRLESSKLERYERKTCASFDHVVWVTDEDRRAVEEARSADPTAFSRRNGAARSRIIPICVEPDTEESLKRLEKPHRVTFIGGLHWPPNADGISWFVSTAWSRISEKAPDLTLTIIGKSPPRKLLEVVAKREDIELLGYLDDLSKYLSETVVFIVPLLAGGGMRVKILDGWRWGLPIVSTTIGAEGISTTDGGDILIADNGQTFSRAVLDIYQDPSLAQTLVRNGRLNLEKNYDWKRRYAAWDDIYSPDTQQRLNPTVAFL